ncbi:MAG: hypothetical protein ACLQFR_14105 [Streptosporangiaceae bacterium]
MLSALARTDLYVFVNLSGRPYAHSLAYPAVHDLVCRLRRETGIESHPHC